MVAPSVRCCDLHNPELLARTRPGRTPKSTWQAVLKVGKVAQEVAQKVRDWREAVFDCDYPLATFSDDGVLADEMVDVLCAIGPILTRRQMDSIVKTSWEFYPKYGNKLWEFISSMASTWPPFEPLPKKPRGRKRVLDNTDMLPAEMHQAVGISSQTPVARKRPRVSALAATSTSALAAATSTSTSGPREAHHVDPPHLRPAASGAPLAQRAPPGAPHMMQHVNSPLGYTVHPPHPVSLYLAAAYRTPPPWAGYTLSALPAPPAYGFNAPYYHSSPYAGISLWPPPRPAPVQQPVDCITTCPSSVPE